MKSFLNIFLDKNGDISSRIVFNSLILFITLSICIFCIVSQKDIPSNALYLLITVITGYVPVSTIAQYKQNMRDVELKLNKDLDSNGKIGE